MERDFGSSEKGLQKTRFLRKRKSIIFPGGRWYKSGQNKDHKVFLEGEIAPWMGWHLGYLN